MTRRFDPDKATHRFADGKLATQAKSKHEWGRISTTGKIHKVSAVIIRWNFNGGTFERPDITYVMECGPQRHTLLPVDIAWATLEQVCARCDSKSAAS